MRKAALIRASAKNLTDRDNCMVNIDYIMGLLDWTNPENMQEEGRILAREVSCINVFIQPCDRKYNKNVWDNCALILSERSDEELRPYLDQLFHWLEDMNWPGAECIYRRLKRYHEDRMFRSMLNECIREATALEKEIWLQVLREFE